MPPSSSLLVSICYIICMSNVTYICYILILKSVPVTDPVVARKVGRGITLLFHDHGTRRGWVVSSTPRSYITSGKDPVPIVQEAGWAPVPIWTGGKFSPTGIRSPDRPTRSQSLYRLSYPVHTSDISWYYFVYSKYTYIDSTSIRGERICFIRKEWNSSKKMRPREILVKFTPLCTVTVHSFLHEFKARAVFASNVLQIPR